MVIHFGRRLGSAAQFPPHSLSVSPSSLLRYGGSMSLQSAMSVRFNSAGTQLLALRRRLPPVLYELHSRLPSFQFDNQGYFNSCTMKSCCFAGDKDQVSPWGYGWHPKWHAVPYIVHSLQLVPSTLYPLPCRPWSKVVHYIGFKGVHYIGNRV
ncbi:unnamed protein product [Oncorhynchus mykiss]|uniref:Uncharacterized protein n=1 Tax=Oncorhynchus mykiss TaxID=8022 RepID=A0A060ZFR7_ONCMY|nr:unnamed protein product [Oncorhynchus mykiss]